MRNISLQLDESGVIFLSVCSEKTKKHGLINLNALKDKLSPIVGDALLDWAKENLGTKEHTCANTNNSKRSIQQWGEK